MMCGLELVTQPKCLLISLFLKSTVQKSLICLEGIWRLWQVDSSAVDLLLYSAFLLLSTQTTL